MEVKKLFKKIALPIMATVIALSMLPKQVFASTVTNVKESNDFDVVTDGIKPVLDGASVNINLAHDLEILEIDVTGEIDVVVDGETKSTTSDFDGTLTWDSIYAYENGDVKIEFPNAESQEGVIQDIYIGYLDSNNRILDFSSYYEYTHTETGVEFSHTVDTTPPGEVSNLSETLTPTEIKLDYELPSDEDFQGVNIYLDGSLIEESTTETSVEIPELTPENIYQVKVTTVDENGNESEGITKALTLPSLEEVQEVKAEAKSDRVDLSWDNPEFEGFHHVNIYRKTMVEEEESTAMSLLVPTVQASTTDEYDPVFETNGTYFNDLTVEAETDYEYKLTTEEANGTESEGVTVQATTAPAPPPTVEESDVSQDENGDYLATWSGSGEGEMLVQVAGEDYQTVPYSDGQLLIPSSDMQYDGFGEPEVTLVPIAPNGSTGEKDETNKIDKSGLFNAKDIVQTVFNLMMFFGPFILLALVIYLNRPILRLIKGMLNKFRSVRM
ncbi:hypothetical protein U3A55_02430 [Salarchaeum sp. III]|uniref:hypothetical protein n=1 Tax=Salarchaeum sp. III TaxID=3107927 RepID=UPI002ED7F52F